MVMENFNENCQIQKNLPLLNFCAMHSLWHIVQAHKVHITINYVCNYVHSRSTDYDITMLKIQSVDRVSWWLLLIAISK